MFHSCPVICYIKICNIIFLEASSEKCDLIELGLVDC